MKVNKIKIQKISYFLKSQLLSIITICLILGSIFWFTDAFINAWHNSSYDKLYINFIIDLQTTPEIYSRITALILLLILGFISIISREKLKSIAIELNQLVFTDSLTGAINRTPFIELLEKFILQSKRDNQKIAILLIDIDKFKNVNDVYGHETGDITLKTTAQIIRNNIRECDFIGRMGGDEFVLCLNNIKSTNNVIKIAGKINDAFTEKIMVKNLLINLTVSIGISIYPDDGNNAIDLIKNSDIAMYKSKNSIKNTFQLYKKKYTEELIMEQELLKALHSDDFVLHYQPIVKQNGQAVCLEALCRWNKSKYGNISPSIFIPILEKNRGINKLGN